VVDLLNGSLDPDACRNCAYAVKVTPAGQLQSQLQCWWGPPQVIVVLQTVASTAFERIRYPSPTVTTFVPQLIRPPVPEGLYCGQHDRRPAGLAVREVSQNVA